LENQAPVVLNCHHQLHHLDKLQIPPTCKRSVMLQAIQMIASLLFAPHRSSPVELVSILDPPQKNPWSHYFLCNPVPSDKTGNDN